MYFVNEYYFFCREAAIRYYIHLVCRRVRGWLCREAAMRFCIQVVCRRDRGGFIIPTYKIIEKRGFCKSSENFEFGHFYFCPFLKNTKLSFSGLLKNFFDFLFEHRLAFSVWIFLAGVLRFFEKIGFFRFFKFFRIFSNFL